VWPGSTAPAGNVQCPSTCWTNRIRPASSRIRHATDGQKRRSRPTFSRSRRAYSDMPTTERLPEPVDAREALRQKTHQRRRRKPPDVEVVALDPLDERGADALDRVRARAPLPLSRHDVRRDVAGVERPEGHARDGVLDRLPAGRDEAEPGDDVVRLP